MSLFKNKILKDARHSVVVKHVSLLFLMIAIVLGAGFYFLYRSGYNLLWSSIQKESWLICKENVNRYDQAFAEYEGFANLVANTLGENPVEQWDSVLQLAIKNMSQTHPEILALGAATIPDAESDDSGRLSLILHRNGAFESRQGTNYADKKWFSDVMETGTGKWAEPFHGQVIPELITVYSCPIRRTMPDGSRKIVGIACLDLEIQWLDKSVSEIELDNQGVAYLLSEQGRFLSSRFTENIGKTVFDVEEDERPIVLTDEIAHKIDEEMQMKQQSSLVSSNTETGEVLHCYFRQMQTTGWVFGVAFPEDVIFLSLKYFRTAVLVEIIGIIVMVLFSFYLMTSRISVPVYKISRFAEEIGKGNFTEPIPVVKGHDEISELALTIDRMRCSLVEYIRSVQKITELEAERAKNRKLLLNTLPEHVIDEFNSTGKCTPEFSENATMFFSDIVDFTTRCSELPTSVVIDELNLIFSHFDRIFAAHGVERIKTIGDAYMAVAGLHPPTDNHCRRVLDAALEIRRFLLERNAKEKLKWEIRIGIHTGPVAAGIVGIERYVYDVFGDTVNTAARMEQLSEPMKINVSEAVYQSVDGYRFTKRPATAVKGKGVIQMYFLEDEEQEVADA